MTTASEKRPIVLDWDEERKAVSVKPRDNDNFVMTMRDAIEACKKFDREHARGAPRNPQMPQEAQDTFKSLLDRLGNWASQHKTKIEHAFLTLRDSGLLFLIVTKERKYDAEIEDDLTQLDIEVAQSPEFADFRLSVLALPECDKEEYESFALPEFVFTYTG